MISITYHTGLKEIPSLVEQVKKKPAIGLKQVMELVRSSDQRLSMRASWVLLHFAFAEPKLTEPLIPQLINFLSHTKIHSGSIRNCIRIFTVLHIPEQYCAIVYDTCMRFLTNPQMPHAVRAFSIQCMLNICEQFPELGYELQSVIAQLKHETSAPSLNVWIKRSEKWFKTHLKPE
jgi:hypothetical protein